MIFQTLSERTNNSNNNAKSHHFNYQNDEEAIRVMLKYINTYRTQFTGLPPFLPPPLLNHHLLLAAFVNILPVISNYQ
jgi:hypothetical protein